MADEFIYEVQDLQSARVFLAQCNAKSVTLINPPGSVHYYGIMVLDYMFKSLKKEFKHVKKIIVKTDGFEGARYAARALKYKYIID